MTPLYIILAAGLGIACPPLFNLAPPRWFVDYGETPTETPTRTFSLRFGRKADNDSSRSGRSSCLKIAYYPRLKLKWGFLLFMPFMLSLAAAISLFGSRFPAPAALALLFFGSFALVAALSDYLYRILPDELSVLLAITGLVFLFCDLPHFHLYLLGALIGGGMIYLIGFVGKLLFKAPAMGFGDVKLAAALGLACGIPNIIYALVLAILLGALASVVLMAASKLKDKAKDKALQKAASAETDTARKSGDTVSPPPQSKGGLYIPFAPFLCGGALISLLFAPEINALIAAYIHLFS